MMMVASEQAHSGPETAAGALNGVERAGYTIAETAAMFGVSQWNIRMAIKEGQIRVLHFGRRLIVPKTEIERLIQ